MPFAINKLSLSQYLCTASGSVCWFWILFLHLLFTAWKIVHNPKASPLGVQLVRLRVLSKQVSIRFLRFSRIFLHFCLCRLKRIRNAKGIDFYAFCLIREISFVGEGLAPPVIEVPYTACRDRHALRDWYGAGCNIHPSRVLKTSNVSAEKNLVSFWKKNTKKFLKSLDKC